ncbi:MAG: fibronectin/fibrinogen-binding protein [Ruminococcaceae bacterium]|nr:fibronectin/fibrinogen-binding protein [Oscillospiraceae bacterium]
MALDGATLHLLRGELSRQLVGARVDKVQQPSREELVLVMRSRVGTFRLLISVRAACPRINITPQNIENPAQPPMFCMLMRKKLGGARLEAIRQQGMDRVLMLDFEAVSELGDRVRLTMIVEIMGRCSNAILVDGDGKIVDALKRVDGAMSTMRMILPGLRYTEPPVQDKLNILECDTAQLCSRICNSIGTPLSKACLGAIQGISPIVARELAHRVCPGRDILVEDMTDTLRQSLEYHIEALRRTLTEGGQPTLVTENGRAIDMTFLSATQYGEKAQMTQYESYSALLDAFCGSRDHAERMKVKEQDLLKLLANAADRTARKLAAQRKELEEAAQRDQLRLYGDLINANIYRLSKGDSFCELENYFDPELATIRIMLDPTLSPSQNAQAYYKEYRRAQTAEAHLIPLIEQGEQELLYIDSVFDALSRARTTAEVAEIRAELTDGGYIKHKTTGKSKPSALSQPMRFVSDDGFEISAGRNNRQNDRLTLKDAANSDTWFHAAKMPGSHVVVHAHGQPVPDSTLEQAAIIAATYSRGAEQGLVPVDYTRVKNVTRMPGGKPGLVNYVEYQTVFVHPDPQLCERLKK